VRGGIVQVINVFLLLFHSQRIIPKIDWSKPTLKPGEAPERTRRSTDYEDDGENDHQEEMEDGKVSLVSLSFNPFKVLRHVSGSRLCTI